MTDIMNKKEGVPEGLIFQVMDGADPVRARLLSEKLGLEIKKEAPEDVLTLRLREDGLSLAKGSLEMHGDLSQNIKRLKQANLSHEMLVKAAKLKNAGEHPLAIDATAGMGEDSLLLAAAGFRVWMYEFDPIIAALLQDSLIRAERIPELAPIVARMQVREENSVEAMKHLEELPDLILLDPMFPARTKSAMIKKKFQLLQQLERPCSNEEDLMQAAIEAKPRKIVIKRPLKGPFLAGIKPEYSLSGKAIRYDCIMFHENNTRQNA